jgi:hypothetical protein
MTNGPIDRNDWEDLHDNVYSLEDYRQTPEYRARVRQLTAIRTAKAEEFAQEALSGKGLMAGLALFGAMTIAAASWSLLLIGFIHR